VSIPNTRLIDFVSKVNGHPYSISVALPWTPAPAKGYPVLYVLDGGVYFASATEAVRINNNAPDVVVVGISYPNTPAFIERTLSKHQPLAASLAGLPPFYAAMAYARVYDMTPPTTAQELAEFNVTGMGLTPAETGGLDDLLKTIETEVKPRVAALARIDQNNQALFGHSLGGNATLHALFTEPTAFRTFIIASPAIWWADRRLLANEAKFSAQVTSGAVNPRVLITVGADEQDVPKLPPGMAAMQSQLTAFVLKSRMVDNARDLTSRLKGLRGARGYEVGDIAIFPHQGHGISPWPAIGRGVAFAFPQPGGH
jgi:predicted alpha/beta superfamily hydrolase